MRWLLAVVVLLAGCPGPDAQVPACQPASPESIVVEISADGTVTFTPP
jgi:hypothetical protein